LRSAEGFWRDRLPSAAWFLALHDDEPIGVAAESVHRVVPDLWQRMFGASVLASGSRPLLNVAVGVAAWAVAAVLLRVSDGLLPAPVTRSVRRAAVRAVEVGAATEVGGLPTSWSWVPVAPSSW
jgi:hypothetical protein